MSARQTRINEELSSFTRIGRRGRTTWDEIDYDALPENQRRSTWQQVEKAMRGPQPYPQWLIEDAAAMDTDLGILKTGKEAEVMLLERATETRSSLLAAKRYRGADHRLFNRSQTYNEGRSTRRSRDARALKTSSTYGQGLSALHWAASEWHYLNTCYLAGVPVPYPVQIDGTEILMEFIDDPSDPHTAAPRLHQVPRADERLEVLWEQTVRALEGFAGLGLAHGDLSPYNILVADSRLVIIDLPQCVDLAGNLQGLDFLHRDCTAMARWFTAKGLHQDAEELFDRVMSLAFTS